MAIVTMPVSDVRKSLNNLISDLERPILVTQHGRVKAVLLSIDAYNDVLDELEDARLVADPDFQASVAEARAGGGVPLEDVLQKIEPIE
jgi:prevent-host-death family protein